MRYLSILPFLFLSHVASYAGSQPADSVCTLSAHVRGLGGHRLIFYYYPTDSTYHGDTIRAHHGYFTFAARLSEPTLYNINTLRDGHPKMHKRTGNTVPHQGRYGLPYATLTSALLENGKLTWDCNMRTFNKGAISNDPLNDTMILIREIGARVYRADTAYRYWRRHITGKPTIAQKMEHEKLRIDLNRREGDSIAAFIIAHPYSYASANMLWRLGYSKSAVKHAAYDAISPALHHLANVSSFLKRIDYIYVGYAPGDTIPDIALADTSGHSVALSSCRGRVTFVDLWASWCQTCRRENPHIVSAYGKYHNKGLEVYAISLDGDKKSWMAAIGKDKLAWTNVSDLDFRNHKVYSAFGIRGLPSNFLLDRNGKIIAMNLRGHDISTALCKAMK